MTEYIKKENKFISVPSFSNNFRTDVFEIVDKIPNGWTVWNIPINADFLPLCQCDKGYKVNSGTLKAIEMPREQAAIIVSATTWAGYSIKELKRFTEKGKNKKLYPTKCEEIAKIIPILEKYGLN